MDLELDEQTHDLKLTNGDLTVISGLDATAQRLKIALLLFLGEWFLDERVGVPYYDRVFVKNPNQSVINSMFRKIILSDQAVTVINEYEFTIDPSTRAARLTFKADTIDGPLVFDQELVL
jgi:hypothetical protein